MINYDTKITALRHEDFSRTREDCLKEKAPGMAPEAEVAATGIEPVTRGL